MAPPADDRAPSPLPPLGHDISRPSSTSTQSSNALRSLQFQQPQSTSHMSLPGLSALASVASDPSPQLRAYSVVSQPPSTNYTSITTPTPGLPGNTPVSWHR
ncbi:hypothetical protein MMC14_002079 [Varicellaria rhodocarpa]|nr:hypothetical protein [Varicellaria rhodocarpa]